MGVSLCLPPTTPVLLSCFVQLQPCLSTSPSFLAVFLCLWYRALWLSYAAAPAFVSFLQTNQYNIFSTGCLASRPLLSKLWLWLFFTALLLPFLLLYVNLCLVFLLSGLPIFFLPLPLFLLLSPSLSLSFSPFYPFISLPCSCLRLPCFHLSLSLSLLYLYCLSILNRSSLITFLPEKRWIQLRGSPPLLLPVAMTTASALSFIEEEWKEGGWGVGGGGRLPGVVIRHSTKESNSLMFFNLMPGKTSYSKFYLNSIQKKTNEKSVFAWNSDYVSPCGLFVFSIFKIVVCYGDIKNVLI